jgi:hypothetical protein
MLKEMYDLSAPNNTLQMQAPLHALCHCFLSDSLLNSLAPCMTRLAQTSFIVFLDGFTLTLIRLRATLPTLLLSLILAIAMQKKPEHGRIAIHIVQL